jgi:hypothetical protein
LVHNDNVSGERGELLTGGAQTMGVMRRGGVVCRPRHGRSEFVQEVLTYLAAVGFTGAPRALGFDAAGRELVSFVPGDVPHRLPFNLVDEQLISATKLVHDFHAAIAGSPLCAGREVVCHGDLGPHNTVFDGGSAIAIIDWSADVAPGPRIVDFAHAVWCYADITEADVAVAEQARRIRLMCAVYGQVTPAAVLAELTARFRRARASHAAAGRNAGVAAFQGMIDWLMVYRDQLLFEPG